MRKINNDEVRNFAPHRIAFETKSHNLEGRIYSDGFRATGLLTGYLPSRYHESVIGAAYVVCSYGTPIAWFKSGEWFIPPVRYSATTSKHQSMLGIFRNFRHDWAEEAPQVSITEDYEWNESHKTFRLLVDFDAVDPRVGFHLHNVWTLTRAKYDWKLDNGEGKRESIGINADWTDERCENIRQAVRATIFTEF